MVLCKSCRHFRNGTIAAGWCQNKHKPANPLDDACISRTKIYHKHKPKPVIKSLDEAFK